jgi:hypothetical protein
LGIKTGKWFRNLSCGLNLNRKEFSNSNKGLNFFKKEIWRFETKGFSSKGDFEIASEL